MGGTSMKIPRPVAATSPEAGELIPASPTWSYAPLSK